MKGLISLVSALVLAFSVAPVFAGEAGEEESVTLQGTLLCAKCSLGHELEQCQNALVITHEDGEETVYYLARNEVAKEAGHPCRDEWEAEVSGTIAEKDGQAWLTPSAIERLDD